MKQGDLVYTKDTGSEVWEVLGSHMDEYSIRSTVRDKYALLLGDSLMKVGVYEKIHGKAPETVEKQQFVEENPSWWEGNPDIWKGEIVDAEGPVLTAEMLEEVKQKLEQAPVAIEPKIYIPPGLWDIQVSAEATTVPTINYNIQYAYEDANTGEIKYHPPGSSDAPEHSFNEQWWDRMDYWG